MVAGVSGPSTRVHSLRDLLRSGVDFEVYIVGAERHASVRRLPIHTRRQGSLGHSVHPLYAVALRGARGLDAVSVSADPDHCRRSASGKHDVWLDDIRAALS